MYTLKGKFHPENFTSGKALLSWGILYFLEAPINLRVASICSHILPLFQKIINSYICTEFYIIQSLFVGIIKSEFLLTQWAKSGKHTSREINWFAKCQRVQGLTRIQKPKGFLAQYYSSMVIPFKDNHSFIQFVDKNALNINFNEVYRHYIHVVTHTRVSSC